MRSKKFSISRSRREQTITGSDGLITHPRLMLWFLAIIETKNPKINWLRFYAEATTWTWLGLKPLGVP